MLEQNQVRLALVRFCTKVLGNVHDAEEAVQDLLLKFLQDGREKTSGITKQLLFAAARNRCFDMLRARRRVPPSEPLDDWEDTQESTHGLNDALLLLPALEREALLLTAVEDIDFRAAAKLMNISLGMLAKLRFQAVERLRRLLNRSDPGTP